MQVLTTSGLRMTRMPSLGVAPALIAPVVMGGGTGGGFLAALLNFLKKFRGNLGQFLSGRRGVRLQQSSDGKTFNLSPDELQKWIDFLCKNNLLPPEQCQGGAVTPPPPAPPTVPWWKQVPTEAWVGIGFLVLFLMMKK